MSSVATLQLDARVREVSASFEVLGTLAHDLRQPLSNIEAIAYYLALILPQGDRKIQEQLAHIRELVRESNEILSSGVRLAASTTPSSALSSETADPVQRA
jgi:signal transduction histidine kinase